MLQQTQTCTHTPLDLVEHKYRTPFRKKSLSMIKKEGKRKNINGRLSAYVKRCWVDDRRLSSDTTRLNATFIIIIFFFRHYFLFSFFPCTPSPLTNLAQFRKETYFSSSNTEKKMLFRVVLADE